MDDKFYIKVETYHVADRGDSANVHELDADKLKAREVVKIDIAGDEVSRGDYKEAEDPTKYKSEKTGRGPLQENWIQSADPV
ncbi:Phosphatidylinositol transfer protein alpha isoform [Caligus rogercresseyi]|uniref:Phosphatidylinositol transfer protein alpha isoform n=1 Tax=Caligus rogercresseyi TaxID=217165 RepID=A0A7T8HFM6_CALRO|nr:Phosphatidylinositol transfer protein alpha isoform [Caligus rogercresseyi]